MKTQLIKKGYKGDFVTHKSTRSKLYLNTFEGCDYTIEGINYTLCRIEGDSMYLVALLLGSGRALVNLTTI